jgi:1-phosphofructokinase family hexose kinase
MFIEEWTPGQPMRTDRVVECVGGKGLDSAVALSQIGVETTGLGFFAGKIGRELTELLVDYGIKPDPVWVDGMNRVAHVITETKTDVLSHIIAGKVLINQAQEQELIDKYKAYLENVEYVIIAGSVPPAMRQDFTASLVEMAKAAGVPVLVDSQKQAMVEVVKVVPDVVKMNWDEFEWTFDVKAESIEALLDLAQAFHNERQLKNLVLTLSKDGIIAVTGQGTFFAKAPFQEPVNAAGAGDAVSSALAWRFTQGDDWESALKWASAVSAASVLTERTSEVRMEDADRIYPDVSVKRL